MGNQTSTRKIGFEDIQYIVQRKKKNYILINTMGTTEQSCLIPGTLKIHEEEATINKYQYKKIHIIIYGKNSNDESIFKKYEQLLKYGFSSVFVYTGGIFEWLLLQDVYGDDDFPTEGEELDILKYKPQTILQNQLLLSDID
jgi:hypothetical protein|tara:strand:+ start:223 stop:648 length:426 start_codon:yes stop_codon:yes gene_type:complete